MENTYWNKAGTHQNLADALAKLVPYEGKCSTPALDLFRRASNLYYQLNNNGNSSCGTDTCSNMFKAKGRHYTNFSHKWVCTDEEFETAHAKVEAAMDKIVLAAAREVGLEPV